MNYICNNCSFFLIYFLYLAFCLLHKYAFKIIMEKIEIILRRLSGVRTHTRRRSWLLLSLAMVLPIAAALIALFAVYGEKLRLLIDLVIKLVVCS